MYRTKTRVKDEMLITRWTMKEEDTWKLKKQEGYGWVIEV